jgi:hypothetical protein
MDHGGEAWIEDTWPLEAYLTHLLLQQLAKVPKCHPRRVTSYFRVYFMCKL